MKFAISTLIVIMPAFFISCADGGRGGHRCATELSYVTNHFTAGDQALRHASEYYATIPVGSSGFRVKAIVDTASANLVINEKSFDYGDNVLVGQKPFVYDNGHVRSVAVNAKDTLDMACLDDFSTRFSLTSKDYKTPNYLGLAFSDGGRYPHESKSIPFFDQLVKKEHFDNVFSLALCGTKGNSRLVLGGFDERMQPLIGNFIPIIEKTAYVVPAKTLRRADTKKIIGEFPSYDRKTKTGMRTIIDSAASFLMFPREMAVAFGNEIEREADTLGFYNKFPTGFFRTERFNSTKVIRFSNQMQIKQFPSLEITFLGIDGKLKSLELSPLHYFKEMDPKDPLLRTFAVRETTKDIILGQPFLENHFILFDRKNGVIGFANIDIACAQ